MSKFALQKKIDDFGDNFDADATTPLPNLGHLSRTGESLESGADHANADVIDERLRQLVGLLESMHLSIEKIAELMAKQDRRSRPRTAKRKKSASRKSRKA